MMKISAFATKFGVKKSTIRYYTDNQLLMPKKIGNAFHYGEDCVKDMVKIQLLRDMGFTIEEVQHLIFFERLHVHFSQEEQEIMLMIIQQKINELLAKKEKIEEQVASLSKYKNKITTPFNDHLKGIPYLALSLLKCPKCNATPRLTDSQIQELEVVQGKLICSCGYEATIEDGILIASTSEHKFLVNDYKKLMDGYPQANSQVMDLVTQMGNRLYAGTDEFWEQGDVYCFMEADTELFMMGVLDKIRPEALYIVTQVNLDVLKKVKHAIEEKHIEGQFLFVKHNGELPIAHNVDRFVDLMSNALPLLVQNKDINILRDMTTYAQNGAQLLSYTLTSYEIVSSDGGKDHHADRHLTPNIASYLTEMTKMTIKSRDHINNYKASVLGLPYAEPDEQLSIDFFILQKENH